MKYFIFALCLVMGGIVYGTDYYYGRPMKAYKCSYSQCDLCHKELAEITEIPDQHFGDDMMGGLMMDGSGFNQPQCTSTETPQAIEYSTRFRVCQSCKEKYSQEFRRQMNVALSAWLMEIQEELRLERNANDKLAEEKIEAEKKQRIVELENQLKELKQ